MGTAARHPLTIDDTGEVVTRLCRFRAGRVRGRDLGEAASRTRRRRVPLREAGAKIRTPPRRARGRACEDAPVQRALAENLVLDDDVDRVDVDAVHDFLSNHAYWAEGRPHDVVRRLIGHATRIVGLYDGPRQVGFARAFTDGTSVVYLADVYVLPAYRGRGLGSELVREMIEHGPLRHLCWILHTRDAHPLYRRFGFGEPTERVMERAPAPR